METNLCPGCKPNDESIDHFHQFTDADDEEVSVWYLDGKPYTNPSTAVEHLELGMTTDDAFEYIHNLPKKES